MPEIYPGETKPLGVITAELAGLGFRRHADYRVTRGSGAQWCVELHQAAYQAWLDATSVDKPAETPAPRAEEPPQQEPEAPASDEGTPVTAEPTEDGPEDGPEIGETSTSTSDKRSGPSRRSGKKGR